jgi:hypothetical protein
MKTAHSRLQAGLVIIALTLASLASVYPAAAQTKSTIISKKELMVLLKTATEPPEHQKIAEYYRHEAQLLTNSSKEHQELAAIYAKNPPFPAMESKHGDAFGQGASHCRRWGQLEAEQAKLAQALATIHEDMAKAAEQKQQ